MKRRRVSWLAVSAFLSLLLCADVITLWIRSYSGSDYISRLQLVESQPHMVRHHENRIGLARGSIRITSEDNYYYSAPTTLPVFPLDEKPQWSIGRGGAAYLFWGQTQELRTFWNRLGFHTLSGGWSSSFADQRYDGIALPAWLPTVIFLILPALWFRRIIRTRRRNRAGLCPHCGYDIRATPQRCPECGRVTLANH